MKNINNRNKSYKGLSRSEQVFSRCESLEKFGYFLKCHQDPTDWTTPERFKEITLENLPEEMRNNQNLILQFVNFYCDMLTFGEYMKKNTQETNIMLLRCNEMREEILRYGFDEITLEGFEKAVKEVANTRFRRYNADTKEAQRLERIEQARELKALKAEVKQLKDTVKEQEEELEELSHANYLKEKQQWRQQVIDKYNELGF